MGELLSIEQVAERLHMDYETVRRWLVARKLKGFKISGTTWRVSEDDLNEHIRASSNKS